LISKNIKLLFIILTKQNQRVMQKKDTAQIIHCISNLATIQQNQGDYSGSETTAIEAIPYLENNKNPNYKWNIYTILGTNNLYRYDYRNALHYNTLALNLKTDITRKSGIKNNIALVYMEMGKYQKAIQILNKLLFQKDVIADSEIFARVLGNIGYCYFKTGNPKAITYLKQSLDINYKNKDHWGLIMNYSYLSEYYKNKNHLSKKYALLTYENATFLNSVDDRLNALKTLIKNSSGDDLKTYSANYIRINDSNNKIRQIAKNQFAKIKYDSKKERNENLKLKAQRAENDLELAQQKNQSLSFAFLTIIGFGFSVFVYVFFKERNKKEKIKISYDTETRIAKKLHDELANDVYYTMSFAENQDLSSSQNKEQLLNNLDAIYSRTRNISKENSVIDTGKNFIVSLKEMMTSFNTNKVNILINGFDSFNWNVLESNKKITVYRVLQELLVNMKKHSKCSLVVITCKRYKNNLLVDYTDNGLEATIKKLNLKNGLQNVENRIIGIEGKITFDTKSDKGFKLKFTIPI
jgi:signal transduction histidine kinase